MPMPPPDKQRRVQSTANIGGRTKSSFQFDADPNTLMRRFTKTGDKDIFQQTKQIARYGDFSEIPDFFTACLQVQQMEEEFAAMPSEVRNYVDNDVSQLVELLADPNRIDEAIKLGLVEPNTEIPFSIPTAPELGAKNPGEIIEETTETSSS